MAASGCPPGLTLTYVTAAQDGCPGAVARKAVLPSQPARHVVAREQGDGDGGGSGASESTDERGGGGEVLVSARLVHTGLVDVAAHWLPGFCGCLKPRPVLGRCLGDVLGGD